jgi:hypothetical protein
MHAKRGTALGYLTFPTIALLARSPAAAAGLPRFACEAIFPIDLAAKLVSFGNVARLNARGVSASGTHSRRGRLVALSDSTLEVGVDLGLDVAVGTRGDRDAPRELARIFQTLTLVVGDSDAPIGQLARRNYPLALVCVCHLVPLAGDAALGVIFQQVGTNSRVLPKGRKFTIFWSKFLPVLTNAFLETLSFVRSC